MSTGGLMSTSPIIITPPTPPHPHSHTNPPQPPVDSRDWYCTHQGARSWKLAGWKTIVCLFLVHTTPGSRDLLPNLARKKIAAQNSHTSLSANIAQN